MGLVLSGGGAPGIAHIGVIKALEENKIPIDYITGTSIGAVVGGLYAMAYSPNEIIQFFKSKDFNQWSNGETTPSEIYYFKISDAKPCLFEINYPIKKDKLLNWKTDWIPSSLLSPHDMNYAFVPLSAQANAIVAGDFDTLFVPFRCVASDVYNKRAYVFRNGQLSNAIRASMTFPFAIKPIEIENHLLFDGGIYNNFPVDIMQADFQPDYIIGSVVAYNPPKADKQDVLMQLQNMIIHNTEYSIPADNGLLLNFDLKKYDTFDFTKVDELVQIGYDSVMAHLDEIKAKISVRISTNEIDERRAKFRSRFPELTFQDMKISGVDSIQEKYLLRLFGHKKTFFGLEDFKKGYCKLISDDRVTEVVPQAIYDSTTQKFHLKLDIEAHDQLKVSVGGNLSTSNANQLYVGLKYQNLNKIPTTISIDAQTGEIYSGIEIGTRIEIPSWTNMFLKLSADIHKSDYYTVIKVFFENSNPTFSQYETVGKLVFGLPMGMNSIICLGTGYGLLTDIYSRDRFLENQTIGNDKSSYSIGKVFAKVEGNILNNAMYPTNGQYFTTSIQLFKDNEKFVSNNNSTSNVKSDLWLQFSGKHEQYFSLSSYFSLGTYAELVYSTHNLLENYTSTLIQATAFQPTTFTRTIFNETFRSNQFVAIGIKPIYNFNGNLHLRSELYWFLPYQTINNAANQAPYYSYGFNGSRLLWESALVYNFTKASAGFYVNYSTGKWNVGLNVGILLPKLRCTD
ncbi:MAG: patatin [Paludibacter sp.]|nr:patatin [Paludibacter sp.]